MKKLLLILFVLNFTTSVSIAQESKSILQTEHEKYSKFNFTTREQWDSLYKIEHPNVQLRADANQRMGAVCKLKKRVFGWQPYWGAAVNEYDYSTLTDMSYFGYDVNPNTGGYTSIHDWYTNPWINKAFANGVKVNLCAVLFANHSTLLDYPSRRQALIDNLIYHVKQRGATGVNIDFEGMTTANGANFATFMIALGQQLHAAIPGSELSIAVPAVDWGGVFKASMIPYVDLFIIMGYDYHWSSGPNAGPPAPKCSGNFWTSRDNSSSITSYLKLGIPASKLCLGVPYYGYDWPTASLSLNAATTGTGVSSLYPNAASLATTYGRKWDNYSQTPYFTYTWQGSYRQCWYEDEQSLGLKYDVVNKFNLAGIGIWALGYDDGSAKLENTITNKLSDCIAPTACSGTITDMGDIGNYYNDENWSFTIAPPSATSVSLTFSTFNVESGYDFLYVYNGGSTTSPLIGKYSGTTNPPVLTANSGQMTLKFVSDYGTTATGWSVNWSCSTVLVAANIVPNKTTYLVGDQMTFTYSGASGTTDWIGIYKQGQSPNTSTSSLWSYVTTASGTRSFSSSTLASGTYEAYLFCCDGYTVKAKTIVFTVTDKSIKANKSAYIKGDQMVFTYTGASGTTDWIGSYKQGQSPSTSTSSLWTYVTTASGTKSFSSSALAAGTYEAYLFCCDGYTVKAKSTAFTISTTIATKFNQDPISGSEEVPDLRVYPNPTQGLSTIEFEEEVSGTLEILDVSGRLVYSNILNKMMSYTIDISDLNKGIYFIRFNGNNSKLILQ